MAIRTVRLAASKEADSNEELPKEDVSKKSKRMEEKLIKGCRMEASRIETI